MLRSKYIFRSRCFLHLPLCTLAWYQYLFIYLYIYLFIYLFICSFILFINIHLCYIIFVNNYICYIRFYLFTRGFNHFVHGPSSQFVIVLFFKLYFIYFLFFFLVFYYSASQHFHVLKMVFENKIEVNI